MTILEMALIAAGLSMDIFAWTACRSTLFSNVGRKKLFSFIGAFGIWELISISLGFYGKAAEDDKAAGSLGRFYKTDRCGNLLCPGSPDAAACHGKGAD